MNEFTNTTELVQSLLTNDSKTRNSDNYLFYMVCKTILGGKGIDIETIGFSKLFRSLKEYNLPQFETVGRIRRKLQHDLPELACCVEVGIERAVNKDAFKEFAREGGWIG